MHMLKFAAVTLAIALMASSAWAGRGVTEIDEGTVRQIYIDKPLVGAKGYVVADWEKGQVRIEAMNFPQSETGYEVFLFEIDIPALMPKLFVDGIPDKGVVPNPPPFDDVAGLISQWKSLGDLEMNADGTGKLVYDGGDNLYETGLNMIMIFEKVTAGQHPGPEDVSKLMVECNGPLAGAKGTEGMDTGITVMPKI